MDWQSIDDPGAGRNVVDKRVRSLLRDNDTFHLEIATAGAAQAGDMPRIVHGHLIALKVKAQRCLVAILWIPRAGKSHKVRGMVGTTAEWPSTADAIARFHPLGSADGARRGHDECMRVREPAATNVMWKITSGATIAASVANEPSYRPVKRGGCLNNRHELDGCQLRSAECSRQEEAKQACLSERHKNLIGRRRSRSKLSRVSAMSGASRLRDVQERCGSISIKRVHQNVLLSKS